MCCERFGQYFVVTAHHVGDGRLTDEQSSGFLSCFFNNTDLVACVILGDRSPFSGVSSYIVLRMHTTICVELLPSREV